MMIIKQIILEHLGSVNKGKKNMTFNLIVKKPNTQNYAWMSQNKFDWKQENKAIKDAHATFKGIWLLQAQGYCCNPTQPIQT
jgi:hypothetical protein